MAIEFEFYTTPYALCEGKKYYIGDTISKPAGTEIVIFSKIKCKDPGDTTARAQLVVHWDGFIQESSGWREYSEGEIKSSIQFVIQIPDSEKEAAFYIDTDEPYQVDPQCCIILKPPTPPTGSWKFVSTPYWDGHKCYIDYEGKDLDGHYFGEGYVPGPPEQKPSGTLITKDNPQGKLFFIQPTEGQDARLDTVTRTIPPQPQPEEIEINISLQGGTPSVELITPVFISVNISLQGGIPSVELEVEELEPEPEEEEIKITLQGGTLTVKLTVTLPPPPALTHEIVVQNQASLTEALSSRTAEFKIAGWTKPPFICFICGETLNTEEDFITHLAAHLSAYEEGEE